MKPLPRLLNALALAALLAACAPAPSNPTPTPELSGATSPPAASSAVAGVPTPSGGTPAPAEPGDRPTSSPVPPSPTPEPRDPLFDPQRISYEHNFALLEIQAYLENAGSVLKDARFQVGDRSMSFAHVLTGLSSLYSINPKLLLALAELHGGLISNPQPSADHIGYAMGYRGDGGGRRGLYSQLRWAARELRWATRDYAAREISPLPPLTFADGSRQEVAADIAMSRYVLARVLAPTTSPGGLGPTMDALVNTYARLFDDPRLVPSGWPAPAQPFLTAPMEGIYEVTSFFDHDAPFLQKNGSLLTFWGRSETDIAFAYDGHTGWDYAMAPPDIVLAAGDGVVVFAGNSDDGCASPARAVIIDHGNGYRTLYWHLARIDVEPGQPITAGTPVGMAGESGCAIGAHLHLQVQYLGRDVDPYGWCGADPDPWARSPVGQLSVWLWADMPSPCGPPAPGTIVVDDGSPGFLSAGGEWQLSDVGYGGGSRFAAGSFAGSAAQPWLVGGLAAPTVAAWRADLPRAGRYRVLAYIPYALNGLHESRELRYLIRHRDGESLATVNAEEARNWWADLGAYTFDPAEGALVSTSTLAGDERRGIWVDAVAFVPVDE